MRFNLKFILFAIAPLVALLGLSECIAQRQAFTQVHGSRSALGWWIESVGARRAIAHTEERFRQFGAEGNRSLYRRLYQDAGDRSAASPLSQLEERYRSEFQHLVRLINEQDARLVVLYIPPPFRDPLAQSIHRHSRAFFRQLAIESGANFLDLTDSFQSFDAEAISLLPGNYHPGRFAHGLIAEQLATQLKPFNDHRSTALTAKPARLSTYTDLKPNQDLIRTEATFIYRLRTNREGIRRHEDLKWPRDRTKLRVLVLGDSVTFGLPLAVEHTFPHRTERLIDHAEVLNAGVLGYSIPQQRKLYEERAHLLEPDVVVLQVYFNDLTGLLAWDQRAFLPPRLGWFERARAQRQIPDTELEATLLR